MPIETDTLHARLGPVRDEQPIAAHWINPHDLYAPAGGGA
jgi:hypothetical protein